jgi:hypothetical protein
VKQLKNQQPKRHTLAPLKGGGMFASRCAIMVCTTCGKLIEYKERNKRCKGGR